MQGNSFVIQLEIANAVRHLIRISVTCLGKHELNFLYFSIKSSYRVGENALKHTVNLNALEKRISL
jgi:hypothetical protein